MCAEHQAFTVSKWSAGQKHSRKGPEWSLWEMNGFVSCILGREGLLREQTHPEMPGGPGWVEEGVWNSLA